MGTLVAEEESETVRGCVSGVSERDMCHQSLAGEMHLRRILRMSKDIHKGLTLSRLQARLMAKYTRLYSAVRPPRFVPRL